MKILVAGDFCPSERVAVSFERKDYASVLSEVPQLTQNADYSIVNFECPVVYHDASPIIKKGPNFLTTTRKEVFIIPKEKKEYQIPIINKAKEGIVYPNFNL